MKVSFGFKLAKRQFSLVFRSAVADLPHREKVHKGGEDAHFASEKLLVVADGVGGWAEQGVDPALFSRELCLNISEEYKNSVNSPIFSPKSYLVEAAKKSTVQGSCTACYGVLDPEKNYLHTVNLGDSGFFLLRKEEGKYNPIFRSKEQQYSFNFPYQVGTGGTDPNLAEVQVFEVKEGDLVIFGTDGLWDNVYDNMILSVLSEQTDVASIANILGSTAQKLSMSYDYNSPFAMHSAGRFIGGKEDDITIVVGELAKI